MTTLSYTTRRNTIAGCLAVQYIACIMRIGIGVALPPSHQRIARTDSFTGVWHFWKVYFASTMRNFGYRDHAFSHGHFAPALHLMEAPGRIWKSGSK